MNRLPNQDRVRIVRCLVEGNSIRSTCRITGFAKGTVLKLLADLGSACARFHDERIREVDCKRVQCDELWSFCYAKERTAIKQPGLKEQGDEDVWTWTGIDADTKLMVSWLMADKGPESAQEFMHDLAGRVTSRMQLTTDGNRNYLIAVPGAFGREIDYAMIKKTYGDPKPDGRIGTSQLECVGIRKQWISGNPDKADVSTSYMERQNLTIRMCSRRYTRLTNAFSKKLRNHGAAFALHFTYYNFCRVHQTLKLTPAQAAGLADHAWPLDELVNLLETEEQEAIAAGSMKRAPYKAKDSS